MKRLLISCAALALLSACSAADQAKAIASTGQALTTADQLATKYVMLPLCPAGATRMPNGTVCSLKVISDQMKADAQIAHDAYKAAEANPTSATAATAAAALVALQALVPLTTAAP